MKIVFKTCGFNLTNLHLRFFLLTCQQLFQFRIHQGKSQYSLNNVPKTCGRKTDSVHNEEQIQRHVLMENQAVIPNSEAAYRQAYLKSTAPDIPRGQMFHTPLRHGGYQTCSDGVNLYKIESEPTNIKFLERNLIVNYGEEVVRGLTA